MACVDPLALFATTNQNNNSNGVRFMQESNSSRYKLHRTQLIYRKR